MRILLAMSMRSFLISYSGDKTEATEKCFKSNDADNDYLNDCEEIELGTDPADR